jgi:hypothetical protein
MFVNVVVEFTDRFLRNCRRSVQLPLLPVHCRSSLFDNSKYYILDTAANCVSIRHFCDFRCIVDKSRVNRFLGAFAKLRKATISFVMSVRAHGKTWLPVDGFWWNLVFEVFFFRKSVKKTQSSWRFHKNNGYLHKDVFTFMTVSR